MEALFRADIIWAVAGLLSIALIGNYVTGRIRARMREQSDSNTSNTDLLANFRAMHAKGELTDEEFRTIKTNLLIQIQRELKHSDETG